MKALYAIVPFSEAEITGTALEWAAFASALSQNGSVVNCETVADASPYQKCSKAIRILHIKGFFKVVFLLDASADPLSSRAIRTCWIFLLKTPATLAMTYFMIFHEEATCT